MPRFRGITEVIQEIAKQIEQPTVPYSNPMSVYTDQTQAVIADNKPSTSKVFVWGLSTWGVDVITSETSPFNS